MSLVSSIRETGCFSKNAELSLLDTSGTKVLDWYVCYFPREPYYWFAKYLEPGFAHVELARPIQYGPALTDVVWLHLIPTFETLDAEVSLDPTPPWVRCPSATIQRVSVAKRLGVMRSWWDMGPPTCVEFVKAALGISAFFVRTPYQLYTHIAKRGGVIKPR